MKIGVISDTHGDLRAWQKAVGGPFLEAELILHAGDVFYHGPKNPLPEGYGPQELAAAINASATPVVIARGNCDAAVDQLLLDYPIQSPYALVSAEGVRILVNHGDEIPREKMWEEAQRHRVQIRVFGHIHIPVLEVREGVALLNPGSPALPKSPAPTVGLIDTDARTLCIVDLDTSATLQQAAL